jgi:hypothetical protein
MFIGSVTHVECVSKLKVMVRKYYPRQHTQHSKILVTHKRKKKNVTKKKKNERTNERYINK